MPERTIFLKLGGSLITDKHRPHTALPDVLSRLASEIAAARESDPGLRLLIGHGSGSFGHVAARKHRTRQGVFNAVGWRGFAEVWREAAALNQIVMQALHAGGLPVIAFAPSASLVSTGGSFSAGGRVATWNTGPIQRALAAGLIPVIYGDVVFDETLGGTIYSTEDLFAHLALELRPDRIGLAGLEPGVWADFPACTRLIAKITPASFPEVVSALGGSTATDVTGGMSSKVLEMLRLADRFAESEVYIFSGVEAGNVQRVLAGEHIGTLVAQDKPAPR